MRPNYLPIALKLLFAIPTLFSAGQAYAANWYVRPTSVGSSTGADWNNAWSPSGISWGSIKPGDTVWLAGGTYSQAIIVQASGSSSAPILIIRASAGNSAAASAAGWNPSFDSQVVINGKASGYVGGANTSGLDIPTSSYITINGNQNSGSLIGNTRVYGIKVVTPSAGGSAVEWGENYNSGNTVSVTNLSLINIDLLGPYNTESHPGTLSAYGFNLCPYNSSRTNILFHDCRVAGYCESFRENMWTNSVIEYCYIADEANDGTDHEDVDLYYHGTNQVWRYNVIANSPNDGIAIGPDGYGPWYFYGNVYWNSFNWVIKFDGGNSGEGSAPIGPYYIYNNIFGSGATNNDFANTAPGWVQNIGTAAAGSQVYNNIFYNVDNRIGTTGVASDYNAYFANALNAIPSETHSFTFSSNPFVNAAGGDFHLTAAGQAQFQKGIALAANGFFNIDMDGQTRGTPWYIGAYQYGGTALTPPAPADFRKVSPP
jgi:hypothetical protein